MGKVSIKGKVNVNTIDGIYKYNYNDYLEYYNNNVPDWVVPSDWNTIPEFTSDAEEVIYCVFAVYEKRHNWAAVKMQGDYTVDWGDGTVSGYTSAVMAEHQFDFDTYTGTTTSEGWKSVLIKITPQSGHTLTYVSFNERPTI